MPTTQGASDNYKWGFKTKEAYILHLKNELDKANRAKREAEYQIKQLTKELKEDWEMRYQVKVPPTMEQGSYSITCKNSYMETYREDALSQYNSAREHDGLEPIRRMPNGTIYTRINKL